jgi:transcriptional regulator with XRE-family HTH domain
MGRKPIVSNLNNGKVLKEMIKNSGFTQRGFAAKLDYTPEYISCLVRGERSISIEFVRRVAEKFPELKAQELLEGDAFSDCFFMRKTYFDVISNFDCESRLLLYDALFDFAFNCVEPKLESPLSSVLALILGAD